MLPTGKETMCLNKRPPTKKGHKTRPGGREGEGAKSCICKCNIFTLGGLFYFSMSYKEPKKKGAGIKGGPNEYDSGGLGVVVEAKNKNKSGRPLATRRVKGGAPIKLGRTLKPELKLGI